MIEKLKKIWRINSSRKHLAAFAERASASIPDGGHVLDAGAGECPYKDYFSHTRYDSTDLCRVEKVYGKLSFISDISKLPIHSDSYDLVFCSQTLEHMTDPLTVIKEISRVIKPGGQLWLTAPLYYTEHEIPFDYYRYTKYGLIYLFENAGLEIESIDWLEGYFGTLSYQLKEAAKSLPLIPGIYGKGIIGWLLVGFVGLVKGQFALLSVLFTRLDIRYKYISSGHNKNYAIIATKPVI
jgi:SAM-dependent methyltransferase